jgi:hypothetical protein
VTSGGPSSVQSVTSSGAGGLPESFTVEGVVVDPEGVPVEGALVLQGGAADGVETGPDGAFELAMTSALPGAPTVVAAKIGSRSAGLELDAVPSEPLTLVLRPIDPPDNAQGYEYGHPGVGDPTEDASTEYCGHCHTTFAAQFQGSAHARSVRDPLVQDLYAGVASALDSESECISRGGRWRPGRVPGSPSTTAPRCYVGDGVLPDLNGCGGSVGLSCDDPALPAASRPTRFGACADCHALGMNGPAGGRDLLEAQGIEYDYGNHCDACHHVREVDLDAPAGSAGRLVVQRPRERRGESIDAPLRQAMFGPYFDVPNEFMGGSPQPQFSTATFCAGCHELAQPALVPGTTLDPTRWPDGLPVHSTYSEWLDTPWADAGVPCQGCHMPPVEGLFNSVDVASADKAGITFGFARNPEQIRSHAFVGPLSDPGPARPRLIEGVVQLSLSPLVDAGSSSLEVEVELVNVSAAHAVPTGEPMRALVLLVEASACGSALAAQSGPTIDDLGGALAEGTVGVDVATSGSELTWPAGNKAASVGDVVRILRKTGEFVDYDGVGRFAGAVLAPSDKGLPVEAFVDERVVLAVGPQAITLDAPIAAQPGDRIALGQAVAGPLVDGAPSRALAGAAGLSFARVLVDEAGRRAVPHHRATDLVRDNRLRPLVPATVTLGFALPSPLPSGCSEAAIRATLLYRPMPLRLARERGWDARDTIVDEVEATTSL